MNREMHEAGANIFLLGSTIAAFWFLTMAGYHFYNLVFSADFVAASMFGLGWSSLVMALVGLALMGVAHD